MNKKGFTFAQMATLILVILGLTVGVILASTQLSSSAGSISQLGSQATEGTQAAVSASAGIACKTIGGVSCGSSCDTYLTKSGQRVTTPPTGTDVGANIGCQNDDGIDPAEAQYCCAVVAKE